MSFIPPTFTTTYGNVIPGQRNEFVSPQVNASPLSGRVSAGGYPPGYPPGYPNTYASPVAPRFQPVQTYSTYPTYPTYPNPQRPNVEVNVTVEEFSAFPAPIFQQPTPILLTPNYQRPSYQVRTHTHRPVHAIVGIVTALFAMLMLLPLMIL